MALSPTVVWFRQDLRLQDNPALRAAMARGEPVIPLYIQDDAAEWGWPAGPAARWWLQRSLAALDASLREAGSRLILAHGDAERTINAVVHATGAGAVYWNRRYELAAVCSDGWLESELARRGIEVRTFNAALLNEPHEIANRQGRPFQVFSAYWRHCRTLPVAAPWRFAGELPVPASWPTSQSLAELELDAMPPVRGEQLAARWVPGENAARMRLREFLQAPLENYADGRDILAADGTSRLSAHLHFGEIGPRQICAAVRAVGRTSGVFPPHRGAAVFLDELGWREFAHHLLFNFPHTQELPLRDEYTAFPWADDPGGRNLRAWQTGQTGYPVVDAGMRQLAATGWMHNRARMIVASFLVKHLRLPWRDGARWFWQQLVDADLANNTLGWQWSAGCGADAAPYFRIFSPVLQGQKFDPEGEYVRRWVPELGRLPATAIHAPWAAAAPVLAAAGVRLGETYPRPMVDHATARADALGALRQMRERVTA